MKKKDLGKKTKQGIIWTGASSIVLFSVRLGTSMVVARLLFPEDFGLMGIASIVIQFAIRLTSFGLNTAIIQRKELKPEHLDTTFWINLLLVTSVTVIVFLGADYIASFFNNSRLPSILRVVSTLFIIRGLTSINSALLIREMKFRELSLSRTISESIIFISPIFFALANFGVWSLVWGQMLGELAIMMLLYYHTRWVPRLRFRIWALKDIFSFGFWIFITRYLTYFVKKIDYIIIGKYLGTANLGYYERAFALIDTPRGHIEKTINKVLFSAYSQIQDDDKRIVDALKKVIRSTSVISYGFLIWMFFAAPSLITVLYGPKWVNSIAPLQIMCVSGLVYSTTILFTPVINAKALVAKGALCQFVYLVILSIALWYGLKYGINGVAWGVTISSTFYLILILLLICTHLPFSPMDLLSSQKAGIVYGCIQIAVLVVFSRSLEGILPNDSILMLMSVSVISFVSYVGAHLVIRFEDVEGPFNDMLKESKKIVKKFPIFTRT